MVEQSFIREQEDAQDREAVEAAEHAEGGPPSNLGADQRRDEGTEVGTCEEAGGPDVDLACTLLEEEKVVDDAKADDLWGGAEETLKSTAGGKSSVARCVGGADAADEAEELGPEEDGESDFMLDQKMLGSE